MACHIILAAAVVLNAVPFLEQGCEVKFRGRALEMALNICCILVLARVKGHFLW